MVFKSRELSYWVEGPFSCLVSTLVTIRHILTDGLFSLVFTGALVLGGFTHIRDPFANFWSPFSGSTTNPNSLATALVKTNFAFSGWQNAFNIIGEVHTRDPGRTVRKAGFLSLLLATCLFFFVNVAYVAAVPKDEISNSGQLIAALFFQHVFGEGFAAKILPIMVALSCFGNIVCNLYIPHV
jgi:amino acid transporter